MSGSVLREYHGHRLVRSTRFDDRPHALAALEGGIARRTSLRNPWRLEGRCESDLYPRLFDALESRLAAWRAFDRVTKSSVFCGGFLPASTSAVDALTDRIGPLPVVYRDFLRATDGLKLSCRFEKNGFRTEASVTFFATSAHRDGTTDALAMAYANVIGDPADRIVSADWHDAHVSRADAFSGAVLRASTGAVDVWGAGERLGSHADFGAFFTWWCSEFDTAVGEAWGDVARR